MHVVEPEHHRIEAPEFSEQRADFELETLLRAPEGVGREAGGRRVVRRRRHDLRVPTRRERSNHARQTSELLVALQAVERFEYGQVGLASSQPLRASSAPDADRFAALLEVPDECFDECRLPDARFAGDNDQSSASSLGLIEFLEENIQVLLAPDDVRVGGGFARRNRDARECRRDRRIVRQIQPVHDFACTRPQPGILLERFENQLVDRAWQFGIQPNRRLRIVPQDSVQRAHL